MKKVAVKENGKMTANFAVDRQKRRLIRKAVDLAMKQYGEVFRKLAKE